MSIIYDALKKVETSQTDDSKTKIDKGFKSKLKIYLVVALMVCLGLFVANIFYEWLIPKPLLNTTEPAALQTKEIPPAFTPLETTGRQEKNKVSLTGFTLNGVFFSGAEGYALINNRIVKKGDKIDGATVVQVLLDEVDLDFGGSLIKLSNNAR